MKLTLLIDGKEKIFTTGFVSSMFYRKLLEYDQTIDYTDMGLDDYDEIVGFVCRVFGDQFTTNEFYEGLPSYNLNKTLLDVFAYVRSGEVPKEEEGNEQGK